MGELSTLLWMLRRCSGKGLYRASDGEEEGSEGEGYGKRVVGDAELRYEDVAPVDVEDR